MEYTKVNYLRTLPPPGVVGAVLVLFVFVHCSCIFSVLFPGARTTRSSKTGVGKVFNISQKHPIGTIKLGETGSGVRDMAWLPAQVIVPCMY